MTILQRDKLAKLFDSLNEGLNGLYRAFRAYFSNGSLKAWGVLLIHLLRKIYTRSLPTYLHISLTERCQCRCVHCYARGRLGEKRKELNTEEIKSLIDQGRQLGAIYVIFSGGEPLLRKDIVELVSYAHRKGLITRINTNGLLFHRQMVSRLKKAGLTQAGVSIDDPDPDMHDKLRGLPGAYQRSVEGIKNLRAFRILCQIQTYASRKNIPKGLKKIISLGKELDVFYVYFFFPTASGAWACSFDHLLTEEEKAKVRELADVKFVHVELATAWSQCRVFARSLISVSPYGEVTPCPFTPFVFGNTRDRPLKEIWLPFTLRLKLKFRGDCVMNDVPARESLKSYVDSIARSYDQPPSSMRRN